MCGQQILTPPNSKMATKMGSEEMKLTMKKSSQYRHHSQFECLVEVGILGGFGNTSGKLFLVGGAGGADEVQFNQGTQS